MEILQEWLPVIATMLIGLWLVGRALVNKMASDPKVDGWDAAKSKMDELDPLVEKLKAWADPESPEVPPTPQNPSGKAE